MTAIDEKEIERLRGKLHTGDWGAIDASEARALLDEVERLQRAAEFADTGWRAQTERADELARERDEARAQAAATRTALDDAYRQRDLARSQAAAQQAVIDRDLVVTPHAETCICPRCRLTVESGRDILDALAKAEAALKYFAEAPFEELPPSWQAARDALAAIQALGISKQRT